MIKKSASSEFLLFKIDVILLSFLKLIMLDQ